MSKKGSANSQQKTHMRYLFQAVQYDVLVEEYKHLNIHATVTTLSAKSCEIISVWKAGIDKADIEEVYLNFVPFEYLICRKGKEDTILRHENDVKYTWLVY